MLTKSLRWLWSTSWGRRWMERYGYFAPPLARVYAREWAYHRRVRQIAPFCMDASALFPHGIDL